MDVPLEHFAVWLHRYYTACALVTHILRFYEAILKIREDHGKLRIYDAKVQEWFTRFPDSDGFHATLLLGKWCGCDKIPSKIKFWYANNPEGAPLPQQDVFISTPNDANLRAHCWFFMPFGNLDVDLTYEQFHADRDASCILFSGGHHPFEVEESWELLQHNRESRVSFHEILRREMTWGELPEETRTLLEKVYAVIQSEIR